MVASGWSAWRHAGACGRVREPARRGPCVASSWLSLFSACLPQPGGHHPGGAAAAGRARLARGGSRLDERLSDEAESCFTFYIHFDPDRPLDSEAIYANWGHRTSPPGYKTVHTVANMHLQDRKLMEGGNFSGVIGASIQDRAMQEGMGPIL